MSYKCQLIVPAMPASCHIFYPIYHAHSLYYIGHIYVDYIKDNIQRSMTSVIQASTTSLVGRQYAATRSVVHNILPDHLI